MIYPYQIVRTVFFGAILIGASLLSAQGGPVPELTFESGNTWLRGGAGMHVAYLGMVRTWDGSHAKIRYVRGSQPIPSGGLSLGHGKDTTHSIWAVTGAPEAFSVLQPSPEYRMSPEPIEVVATAGAEQIAIRGGVVHGMLVRPDGTAWTFSVGDGDITDADGTSNGWIVLSLGTLSRFTGNPPAPARLRASDRILLIDPQEDRGAVVRVMP
jgi:hypothetical protein